MCRLLEYTVLQSWWGCVRGCQKIETMLKDEWFESVRGECEIARSVTLLVSSMT
jgi:hypothetical protein